MENDIMELVSYKGLMSQLFGVNKSLQELKANFKADVLLLDSYALMCASEEGDYERLLLNRDKTEDNILIMSLLDERDDEPLEGSFVDLMEIYSKRYKQVFFATRPHDIGTVRIDATNYAINGDKKGLPDGFYEVKVLHKTDKDGDRISTIMLEHKPKFGERVEYILGDIIYGVAINVNHFLSELAGKKI